MADREIFVSFILSINNNGVESFEKDVSVFYVDMENAASDDALAADMAEHYATELNEKFSDIVFRVILAKVITAQQFEMYGEIFNTDSVFTSWNDIRFNNAAPEYQNPLCYKGTTITPSVDDVTNLGVVEAIVEHGRVVTSQHRQGSFRPDALTLLASHKVVNHG